MKRLVFTAFGILSMAAVGCGPMSPKAGSGTDTAGALAAKNKASGDVATLTTTQSSIYAMIMDLEATPDAPPTKGGGDSEGGGIKPSIGRNIYKICFVHRADLTPAKNAKVMIDYNKDKAKVPWSKSLTLTAGTDGCFEATLSFQKKGKYNINVHFSEADAGNNVILQDHYSTSVNITKE